MLDKLPIEPTEPQHVIIPVDRWRLVQTQDKQYIVKRYTFHTLERAYVFVREVMEYEMRMKHSANILVEQASSSDTRSVVISVRTSGIDIVTEIDKEFARYCDVIFRDVVYNVHS